MATSFFSKALTRIARQPPDAVIRGGGAGLVGADERCGLELFDQRWEAAPKSRLLLTGAG